MAEIPADKNSFNLVNPFTKFPKSKQNQFSIVSWNTLIKTDIGNQNSAEHTTKWDYRLSNIHKTILSFESDIICLQECHKPSFDQDFSDFCIKNKYDYTLNNLSNDSSKTTDRTHNFEMTTAILYKKDKFRCKYSDLRSKTTILLLQIISNNTNNNNNTTEQKECNKSKKQNKKNKPPTAFQLYICESTLSKGEAAQKFNSLSKEEKQPYIEKSRKLNQKWKTNKKAKQKIEMEQMKDSMKNCLFVINVHLEAHGKYCENEKRLNKSEQRFNQIRHSIERVINYVKNSLRLSDIECVQAVFCGDFNEELNSDIHDMLIGNENGMNKNEFQNEFNLKNAYIDNIKGIEKRKDIVSHWISKRLIDHFYYTYNNLMCIMCMETVPDFMKYKGNVVKMKYPNERVVSDHLPIASMFECVESKLSKRILDNVEQDEPEKKKRKLND